MHVLVCNKYSAHKRQTHKYGMSHDPLAAKHKTNLSNVARYSLWWTGSRKNEIRKDVKGSKVKKRNFAGQHVS